ncbi:formin-like protein 3 isoform X2 [Durio zibethinus]|uniref:Formin-like protein n=1 Tax=Durio zibethinus TaxID=66656 RepID=A0A6P5XDH4_DURZI|nr:formin-like protein 3 isoform X2 [Durio zibethinus]
MKMRRVGYAIVFVILLCALAMGSSEGKRRIPEIFFANEGRTTSFLNINEKMAEEAWIHCKKEMAEKRDAIKDFDLYIPQATNDLMSALLAKRRIHKAIDILPPQVREKLFDCLRKKGLVFHASDPEVTFKHWFQKFLEFILKLPNAPRRYLVSLSNPHTTSGPSPALVPEMTPAPAPAPAPALAPEPAPAPAYASCLRSHPPGGALTNSLHVSNMISTLPPPPPPYHKHSHSSPSPPTHKHLSPGSHDRTQHSADEKNDVMKTVFAAVVATAATTFALVTLIFFCCLKRSSGKKDERPLLCLSDLSPDSSQKSISLGNSSNKEFRASSRKKPSFVSKLSTKKYNHEASLAKAPSLEASAGAAFPPLKPPPGRLAPPPPAAAPPPPPRPNPPPPPKVVRPPPIPPKSKPSPLGPHHRGHSASGSADETDGESGAPKAKLKPFFWDKVMANSDQTMVWHEISAGSFQFNEEMIETLFGYNQGTNNKNDQKRDSPSEPSIQYIQIIDPRKAQNLSILLRALNVTTGEVVDALREGNELPAELLQTLQKMAPTTDEELKLRLFAGDVSQLGPAERFLKILVEIPFAFKRIESLLFMSTLHEEVTSIKESFAILEVACTKLKSSRLFLKLLEAVLKTGNRMNDGTYRGGAQAFKLDTLLKLSDVKGIDGKTTLLHFVVREIIRSEGIRAVRNRTQLSSRSLSSFNSEDSVEDHNQEAEEHYRCLGLQVVSGVCIELADVKKAAAIDVDALTSTVSKLDHSLKKTREFMNSEMKSTDEDSEFFPSLSSFVDRADADIRWLSEEEKRITDMVKSTADYFHGQAARNEGLRLFAIVRDFLIMLDKVCKEVRETRAKPLRNSTKEGASMSASLENRQPSSENQQQSSDFRKRLFPAISDRRIDSSSSSSSSDDESSSH